jgi:hypothetical protein
MENEELKSEPQPQADISALQAQFDSLRHLLVSVLVLLIIVSGTLWIYLMRQVKDTSKALEDIRPQATNMIAQYDKARPVLDKFVANLQEFGRTHPDFVPILTKYGLKPAGTLGATPNTSVPTTSSPKK